MWSPSSLLLSEYNVKHNLLPTDGPSNIFTLSRVDRTLQLDDAVLLFILSTAFLYWSLGQLLSSKREDGYHLYFVSPQKEEGLDKVNKRKIVATRNIEQRMTELAKDVVIFWGSQSGKSEHLAKTFARECQVRFGIRAMAADLDLFDFEHLAELTKGRLIGFVVATYGEGDPTDNAAGLFDYLQALREDSIIQLSQLEYFCFGLGNSKYEAYNKFVDHVDQTLTSAGARRIGSVGKADEAMLAANGVLESSSGPGK